jgi:branched-chain amino acid transport system permease protein
VSFLSSQFMSATFDGIANGMIYALIALALVLVWQATHVLNFAQGAMAMFSTFIAFAFLEHGVGYWLALLIAVVFGFVVGGAAERVLIRPTRGKPEINPVVVMVGFLTVIEAVAAMIWGPNSRTYPSPFSQIGFTIAGTTINFSPYDLYTVITVALIAVGIYLLFRYTNLGLKMRASAFAPEVARLLGVRVSRMLTFGWMLAGAIGAVAGVLYAAHNNAGVYPTNLDLVFVFGFIAAAIGGLESPSGAIIGGLIIGLIGDYVSSYYSSGLAPIAVVIVLIIVLMVRPQGIFARPAARRV